MTDRIRPRILVLVHLPPPIHGVTVVNDALVKSPLLNERFELDIVPMRFASDFADIGSFRLSKFLAMAGVALRLVHRFIFRRPDAVYMTPTPTGVSFIRDAMFASIMNIFLVRKIFHLHGQGVRRYYRDSLFYRTLYRWVFWGAQVIHLSEQMRKDISGIVPNSCIHIVPNGVDGPPTPVRREKAPANATPVLLYLSNITRLKGIFVFLDALKILAEAGLDFEAQLAGAPSDPQTMRQFLETCEQRVLKPRVRYLGIVVGDAKDRLFRDADIFIMPTLFEAFGLVAVEAMAYSLPVVASNEGSLPDIIRNGETGLIVEKGNPAALAAAIEKLLRNPKSRLQFGSAGERRFRSNYTLHHWEMRFADVLTECIEAKHVQTE